MTASLGVNVRVSRAASAVADAAFAAMTAPPGADPVEPVLREVRRAMRGDSAGFYTHAWNGVSTAVHIDPVEVWRIVPFASMPTQEAAALNPGIRHLIGAPRYHPFAVTDIIPERLWWNSELHSMMKADWGRNYQFAIPVPAADPAGESQVWVLGRTTVEFGVADREVAAALAPVLTAVTRHRAAMARLIVAPAIGELLTQREITVLDLLAAGATARIIGARLAMSSRTAQKHIEHIYMKLGVHSRQEALAACTALGVRRAERAYGVARPRDDR
jgi:DNA-binding CsgD family transcriptional regulator